MHTKGGFMKITRRQSIKAAMGLTGLACTTKVLANVGITPAQVEGPFYPIKQQDDTDLDLTHIKGNEEQAIGKVIEIHGTVVDENNQPITDAVVDIWQANAAGKYSHENDSSTEPLDPNFQGWGIVKTNAKGQYHFKTIKPGQYLAQKDWTRPSHIHFKISKRGYRELITQMYFKGDEHLKTDPLINELPKAEQKKLIVQFSKDPATDIEKGQFNIGLEKVNKT